MDACRCEVLSDADIAEGFPYSVQYQIAAQGDSDLFLEYMRQPALRQPDGSAQRLKRISADFFHSMQAVQQHGDSGIMF